LDAWRKRKQKRDIKRAYRLWDRERRNAEPYGKSHVTDIDAIFSREIKRLEEELDPGVTP
jgi:hypothetical protein